MPDVRDQDGLHIGPDAVVLHDEAAENETAARFIACIEALPKAPGRGLTPRDSDGETRLRR